MLALALHLLGNVYGLIDIFQRSRKQNLLLVSIVELPETAAYFFLQSAQKIMQERYIP